jgi:hypothetical protein
MFPFFLYAMAKSHYIRNTLLIVSAAILLFLTNKYLLLIVGIALLLFIIIKTNKKPEYDKPASLERNS